MTWEFSPRGVILKYPFVWFKKLSVVLRYQTVPNVLLKSPLIRHVCTKLTFIQVRKTAAYWVISLFVGATIGGKYKAFTSTRYSVFLDCKGNCISTTLALPLCLTDPVNGVTEKWEQSFWDMLCFSVSLSNCVYPPPHVWYLLELWGHAHQGQMNLWLLTVGEILLHLKNTLCFCS